MFLREGIDSSLVRVRVRVRVLVGFLARKRFLVLALGVDFDFDFDFRFDFDLDFGVFGGVWMVWLLGCRLSGRWGLSGCWNRCL